MVLNQVNVQCLLSLSLSLSPLSFYKAMTRRKGEREGKFHGISTNWSTLVRNEFANDFFRFDPLSMERSHVLVYISMYLIFYCLIVRNSLNDDPDIH